jgi:methyltransferase (TIGR00027 family)
MPTTEPNSSVRSVADTALWVAYFRAKESERPDALFRDPYAERLAGERGFHIANNLPDGNKHEWAWVARTYLFDKYVSEEIQNGADLVVNLAAGLDARPYRMDLPPDLQWVEVDLPNIVSYKEEMLAGEPPKCRFQRIALDLSDVAGRRQLFAGLNQRAKKVVVMTEGLLIYFTPEEVAAFAQDLAAEANFQSWVIDLASAGQLKIMQRTSGTQLSQAGAAFKFGPPEGPNFFRPHGWQLADVPGLLQTAAKFKRSPKELRPVVLDPNHIPANFPWTGVCLMKKVSSS